MQLRPLLVERLRTRPKMEWFRELTAAGVACGPINTIDQGVAFADEVGLDPVVVVGKGDEAIPSVRHPITFSATPASYRLPPPSLDQHGEEIRRWLAEPEAGRAWRRRCDPRAVLPHLARHLDAPTRSGCSART